MLRKKNIKNVFVFELKIVFLIFLLVFIFNDFIRTSIKPPVMEFVGEHMEFLKFLIFIVLVFCTTALILIVWWLEWGDKKKNSAITKYVTQLVCENYYGDYRKTDVYRAIKTCLSKFSRDQIQEEERGREDAKRRLGQRKVNRKGFSSKVFGDERIFPDTTMKFDDGIHRTYFKNGKLEKEISYKSNLLDGVFTSYYEDGRLHQQGCYRSGKLDGIYKAYDEDGILYFEMGYQNGKQDGITKIYYKTGVLQYQDTYKNGKRVFRESYNEAGELMFRQKEII